MTVIEARLLRKSYRRGGVFSGGRVIRAVGGVSLTLAEGECLALAGASGSGKSTLGRLLLGLEKPDAGEVFHMGQKLGDIPKRSAKEYRRLVQAVFQNSQGAVNPAFSAHDIIAEPLVNFFRLGGPGLERRVAELLERVGIDPGEMRKFPHQFSGGELQRICLARALAPEPRAIILDEALSDLDTINQVRIMELLKKIRREDGMAMLFISHDMRLVAEMAERVAVMREGVLAGGIVDLRAEGPLSGEFRELLEVVY